MARSIKLATAEPVKKRATPQQRREQLRNALWPGSDEEIWSRQANVGWTTIPRLLPLIAALIKRLSAKCDASSVYWDLWARSYDDAIITEINEADFAFSSGYSGLRATRSWRERILALAEMGFIKLKSEGNREVAHILLVNPITVCEKLYATRSKDVTEEWWNAFVRRANDVGVDIPPPSSSKAVS